MPTSKPKIGSKVTCRVQVEFFYSNYGINKGHRIWFKPGMIGVVAAIAPKVCIVKSPIHDSDPSFAVVDCIDEEGTRHRVGLNFCNLVVVE